VNTCAVYRDAQTFMEDKLATEFACALLAYGAISPPKFVEEIGWFWWIMRGFRDFVISVLILVAGSRLIIILLHTVFSDLLWLAGY
jgi:hypothetical protein